MNECINCVFIDEDCDCPHKNDNDKDKIKMTPQDYEHKTIKEFYTYVENRMKESDNDIYSAVYENEFIIKKLAQLQYEIDELKKKIDRPVITPAPPDKMYGPIKNNMEK